MPFSTVIKALLATNLCAELSTDELGLRRRSSRRGGVGAGAGTSHLDRDNATEGTSSRWVHDLDEADVGLTTNGTGAGCAGGDLGLEWVVLVDVRGALHDAEADEGAGVQAALLGCGDVASRAGDLLRDGGLGAGGEGTGSSGVNDGGVWAGSVSGDDVHGAGDGTAAGGDLWEGGAGLSHDGAHAGESVGASLRLSETVSGGLLGVEDGRVDFGLLVGSGTWDDTSLDTETSGVSTGITSLRWC